MTKSHLTAIARKTLPVPVKWLLANELIHGHVLDYGCGKCKVLNSHIIRDKKGVLSITSYDPHYAPWEPSFVLPKLRWDVILCTYVLCTLEIGFEKPILEDIQSRLQDNGIAYITVRNDKPKGGYGTSSKGTFQRKVHLPYLPLFRLCPQYRIYLLTKSSILA